MPVPNVYLRNALLIVPVICLLAGCGLDETMTRVDKPSSPTEIWNLFQVTLPKSAKNMYLARHTGLKEMEEYMRFDVAPNEIDDALRAIMRRGADGSNDIASYVKLPINAGIFPKPSPVFGRVPWWDLDSIRNGYAYVKGDHWRTFWIDTDRNTVYVFSVAD